MPVEKIDLLLKLKYLYHSVEKLLHIKVLHSREEEQKYFHQNIIKCEV